VSSVPPHAEGAATPPDAQTATATRRLVLALSLSVFLLWAGAGAILPLLPVYLRQRGGSDALVGAVMGAFFIAGVVSQYPAGRLADRVGRLQVLIAGLVVCAVASAGFLLPWGNAATIPLRALQGVGAGAAEVAALAMVGASVPLPSRGAAFGRVYGALIAGLAVGPMVGSLVGAVHMNWIFVTAAVSSLLGIVPVLRYHARATASSASTTHGGEASPHGDHIATHGVAGPEHAGRGEPSVSPWHNRAFLGALVAAAVIGLTGGVYESCWTLLLQDRGAANWQIGLSWTLFAAPFVAMSRPAGWLADHFDRRVVAVAGLGTWAAFLAIYPWLHLVWVMLALAVLEAVSAAVTYPSVQSMLTGSVPARRSGHAQGLFASSETAATGVSATVGGALFGVALWVPFLSCAVAASLLTIVLALLWRKASGRVAGPRSALQVADGHGQFLELTPPPPGGLQGTYYEFGEAEGDEVLE